MREEIISVILKAMEEINYLLEPDNRLELRHDATIFEKDGKLDSLDFVNLVVCVEDNIFEKFNKSITIVSEKAFSKKYNPYANVEKLADFILELMDSENS